VQKERRRNLRAPIPVRRLKVGGSGNVFFGYAGDISASGMFISTVNPRRRGEQFSLQFSLPGQAAPISVTAEVVWIREHSAGEEFPPGMGIRFLEIDERAAAAIRDFVAAGRSDPP
jgi:uncharacterized protein (TIGR02266 family)